MSLHRDVRIGMVTTGVKAFVDTNILLRAFNANLSLHIEASALVFGMFDSGVELWINRQVIREFLVQSTHPQTFSPQRPISQVLEQLQLIRNSIRVADETEEVTTRLLELLRDYPTRGKQVHDANIVATMLVNGVDTLLTMNVADFRRFEGVIRLVPLQTERT
jgi:predicted nucleic acid-binding protein